jgi:hypothetical protein
MSIDAMSNSTVHVCGCRPGTLGRAIGLAMDGGTAAAWADVGEWIVFYWHESKGLKLPSKMGQEAVAGLVASWLLSQEPRDKRPDIDGSVSKGFELTTEQPDRFDSYEQFRVRPIWAEHHK